MRAGRKLFRGNLGGQGLLLIVVLCCSCAAPARGQELVADLATHLIAITTGFTGASVVLFGATDGPGDIAVAVRGPEREMTVRRKSRVAGIWVNTRELTFTNVPSFYAVAASRPIEDMVSPATALLYRLRIANLKLSAAAPAPPGSSTRFAKRSSASNRRPACLAIGSARSTFLGSGCSVQRSHSLPMCRPAPIWSKYF